jgi:perosamine synthetase
LPLNSASVSIPVNAPLLDGNEERYLQECIRTGWISEGPFVKRLEEEFAGRVGRGHGIAVCNGSVALDVAIAALGIGAGDEVILPTFTIISCAAAIVRAGAVPVVVDCEPDTWNSSAAQIADKITPKTKAILVVHIYGLPVDMDPVLDLARKFGLKVIEDAAEMHGQTYKDRPCGSFGDISTFSFYPNKLITTGEGGMVLTDDKSLADRCRSFRNLCFQADRRFVHDELGWNGRMSNLQAAVGVAQLERLDEFITRKRKMGAFYTDHLNQIPGIALPRARTSYAENIYWVYGIVLDDNVPFDAYEAMKRLAAAGIGARPFFWPMHEQPVFRKMGLFAGESYPHAERLARRGFYVPSGVALTEAQALCVVSALQELLQ